MDQALSKIRRWRMKIGRRGHPSDKKGGRIPGGIFPATWQIVNGGEKYCGSRQDPSPEGGEDLVH